MTGAPRIGTSPVRDAQYDAWWEALLAATTVEEEIRLAKDLGMRAIEQHWTIWGLISPQYQVHQPWVIGYNGEAGMGGSNYLTIFHGSGLIVS